MTLELYCVYDEIADYTVVINTANNAKAFIRANAPYLQKVNANYLNEFSIFHVGSFKESDKTVVPCVPEKIDWNVYESVSRETVAAEDK